jgi:hypothetical protein
VNIGKGAALMTGTTWKWNRSERLGRPRGNKTIAEAIKKNIETVGMPKWTNDEMKIAKKLQKSLAQRRNCKCASDQWQINGLIQRRVCRRIHTQRLS